MSALDDLKAAISTANPTDSIAITLKSQTFQLTAVDLANDLGVTFAAQNPTAKNVQITFDPWVNIRSQPTRSASLVGKLTVGSTVAYMTEPLVKADELTWGQLADGRGWFALDLTTWNPENTVPVNNGIVSGITSSFTLPFNGSTRGVGTSAGGWTPNAAELDTIRRQNIQFVLIASYEPGQAVSAIPALKAAGVKHFIIRACMHGAVTTPNEFLNRTLPTLTEYANAIGSTQNMLIAVHNEVNLSDEGLGQGWNTGAEFSNWFIKVAEGYRARFPGCKIGFPAMSPGGEVRHEGRLFRFNEAQFIAGCTPAIQASDWIGVHYYWARPDGSDIKPPVNQWRAWFGSKPLVVTEGGPINDPNINVTAAALRRAYQVFGNAGIPMAGFVLEGAGAWGNADWTRNLGGDVI